MLKKNKQKRNSDPPTSTSMTNDLTKEYHEHMIRLSFVGGKAPRKVSVKKAARKVSVKKAPKKVSVKKAAKKVSVKKAAKKVSVKKAQKKV